MLSGKCVSPWVYEIKNTPRVLKTPVPASPSQGKSKSREQLRPSLLNSYEHPAVILSLDSPLRSLKANDT